MKEGIHNSYASSITIIVIIIIIMSSSSAAAAAAAAVVVVVIVVVVVVVNFTQDIYNYIPKHSMFLVYIMLQLVCSYNI